MQLTLNNISDSDYSKNEQWQLYIGCGVRQNTQKRLQEQGIIKKSNAGGLTKYIIYLPGIAANDDNLKGNEMKSRIGKSNSIFDKQGIILQDLKILIHSKTEINSKSRV